MLDDRRPLEMGSDDRRGRGRTAGARASHQTAAAVGRCLGQDRPRDRAPAGQHRAALRQVRRPRVDRRAEPVPRRSARLARAAVAKRKAAQPPLRDAGDGAAGGTGRNPRYRPGVDVRGIDAAPVAEAPIQSADLIVLAVPSRSFAEVAGSLPGSAPVLSLTKGLDPATGERLSTRVEGRPVAVLSGPNMAEEVAAGLPSATVIASEDEELALRLQDAVNSLAFRVYTNTDLIGVELCAAAKNVIALAAGGVDGLGLGDNGKAALITRGLAEMARLGLACGARPETFSGLAGMGDLVVTCWSRHGRNRPPG